MYKESFWKKYTLNKHNNIEVKNESLILLLVVVIIITAITTTQKIPINYGSTLTLVDVVLLAYLPMSIIIFFSLLTFDRKLFIEIAKSFVKGQKVVFQITTRGTNKSALRHSVESVLYWAPHYIDDWELWIVTEEDVDRSFFEDLAKLSPRIRIIYVPSDYKTPNNTKYKARALHYASTLRKQEYGPYINRVWIYFLDEESVVGEDTIAGIAEFIKENGNTKFIGQGLIVYSNFWSHNLFTSLADSIRPTNDITKLRLQTYLGRIIFGIHGSHLLVRGDIEVNVGWDFGETRAEDTMFALTAWKLYGNIFSWLKGKAYEQSPFSIMDLLRQRRRWIWGTIDTVLNSSTPTYWKLAQLTFLTCWLTALPFTILMAAIFPSSLSLSPLTIPLLFFELSTLTTAYLVGLKLNLQPLDKKNYTKYALVQLFLLPVILTVEILAPWYALLTFHKRRKVGFDVINKDPR